LCGQTREYIDDPPNRLRVARLLLES
jgi:hypothetical protein